MTVDATNGVPPSYVDGLSRSELNDLREQKHKELEKMNADEALHPPSKFFRLKGEMAILTKRLEQPRSAETELAELEDKLTNLESCPVDEQLKSAIISLRNRIEAKKNHMEVQKGRARARATRATAATQKKGSESGSKELQ